MCFSFINRSHTSPVSIYKVSISVPSSLNIGRNWSISVAVYFNPTFLDSREQKAGVNQLRLTIRRGSHLWNSRCRGVIYDRESPFSKGCLTLVIRWTKENNYLRVFLKEFQSFSVLNLFLQGICIHLNCFVCYFRDLSVNDIR